jgi:hypothetical protein
MVRVKMSEKQGVYLFRIDANPRQANYHTPATVKQQPLAGHFYKNGEPNRSAFGKGVPVPSNVTRISLGSVAAETLASMHSERNGTIKATTRPVLTVSRRGFI